MASDLEAQVQEALTLADEHASDLVSGPVLADEAVRLAEELDDPLPLARALVVRLTSRSGPDDLDSRLTTSLRLLGLVRQVADVEVRLQAHLWRLTTGLEQLDLATIRRQLAALDLLADETRDDRTRFIACSRRAMFALTEGDVVGAARLTAEATQAGVTARVPDTESVQQALHAELARQRDDRTALTRAAGVLEERSRRDHVNGGANALLAEAAVLWLEAGEPDRAGRIVDGLAPGLSRLPRTRDWLLVVGKVCEAAAGSLRHDGAAQCVDLLSPYAGRAVLKPGAVAFAGVVDDYLALATGDVTQAERARAAYDRIGADWWARRGPLGRPRERAVGAQESMVLHLHPVEESSAARAWCIGREGAVRLVPAMPGLEHLRLLLERPGVDMSVHELSADPQLSAPLPQEREALIAQTRSGSLADSPRSPTGSDRTRVAVRKAIMTALARLELHDGEVARELRSTIRTGATCRYEPDPFRPVTWRVEDNHLAPR